MKKFCLSFVLLFSLTSKSFAVSEQEGEILREISDELNHLISKVMKARSYSNQGGLERVKYENLLLDLKEVQINIDLAESKSRGSRKIRELNLNYVDSY